MPENINVEVLFFNGRAVGVSLPNFIEQTVMEAEPGFRGDTATGATKPAKISTGASVNVPLFISVGDIIKIDTRTGEYLERVGGLARVERRPTPAGAHRGEPSVHRCGRWRRAPGSCRRCAPGSTSKGSSRSTRRRACARRGRRSTSTRFPRATATG